MNKRFRVIFVNTLQKSREEVNELKAELEVLTMEGNPLNPKGNSLFSEVCDNRCLFMLHKHSYFMW